MKIQKPYVFVFTDDHNVDTQDVYDMNGVKAEAQFIHMDKIEDQGECPACCGQLEEMMGSDGTHYLCQVCEIDWTVARMSEIAKHIGAEWHMLLGTQPVHDERDDEITRLREALESLRIKEHAEAEDG